MADDDLVQKVLVQTGRLNLDSLRELRRHAAQNSQSLFEAAVGSGLATEDQIVSDMSRLISVPCVSLRDFQAKPTLLATLPTQFIVQSRVLPVGLKPKEGKLTLFVAMVDPLDIDLLDAISEQTTYPVSALLAGPLDLDTAIQRCVGVAPSRGTPAPAAPAPAAPSALVEPRLPMAQELPSLRSAVAPQPASAQPTVPNPAIQNARVRSDDIFADVMDDLAERPSDMLSALSMLDDIPRNRHELATSPAGHESIQGGQLPYLTPESDDDFGLSRSGFNREASKSRLPMKIEPKPRSEYEVESNFGNATGFGMPVSERAFQRAQKQGERAWTEVPTDDLLRAVVRVLLERGYFAEADILAALRNK
jgi:hypothetical protein